jgi:hypothetical protein
VIKPTVHLLQIRSHRRHFNLSMTSACTAIYQLSLGNINNKNNNTSDSNIDKEARCHRYTDITRERYCVNEEDSLILKRPSRRVFSFMNEWVNTFELIMVSTYLVIFSRGNKSLYFILKAIPIRRALINKLQPSPP